MIMQAPAHLLVVDTDERLRDLLRGYLKAQGFLVSVARDGSHARSLLSGLEFDLVMLDGRLPDIGALCEGDVALRILSNLADRSLFTARASFALRDEVRDAIIRANDIALVDPYRAATHNKGVMNGIDAVAIATLFDADGDFVAC